MSYSPISFIAGETPTASKWNILGTNDSDADTRATQFTADKTIITLTDGATVTLDLSLGQIHHVTLGGNRTIALSNVRAGVPFSLIIKQDGTGSRTVTWFGTIYWDFGSEPVLSTVAGEADAFVFIPLPGSTTEFYGIQTGTGMA